METELTKTIKQRIPFFRPAMSKMRTIRYAEEVWTPSGIVDVIRFEDYIEKDNSICARNECKFEGENTIIELSKCKGCVNRKSNYVIGILTTCYEVKITVSDFKSKNGHNFHGNDNYYVVPIEIYKKILNLVPEDIGIIVYYSSSQRMIIKKDCKRKVIETEVLNLLLYNSLKKWVDKFQGEKNEIQRL